MTEYRCFLIFRKHFSAYIITKRTKILDYTTLIKLVNTYESEI